MYVKSLVAFPLALILGGCVVETADRGPTRRDPLSIDRDSSEFLRVNLNMGAGNLKVRGGASKFADGTIVYSIPSWKPEVRYSAAAGHGNLTIEQPRGRHTRLGARRYEWDLRLANDVPTDLSVNFGAGEAELRLGDLTLRSVEVQMGVGKLDLDLRGTPKRDYDVRIRGGVGEASVYLPAGVGVYAKASGGIGSIRAEGLRREGNHWINEAYETSKVSIHLDIQGGIGAINIFAQ